MSGGNGHGSGGSGGRGEGGGRGRADAGGHEHSDSARGGLGERGMHEMSAREQTPISRAAAEAYSPGLAARRDARVEEVAERREARTEQVAANAFTSQLAGARRLGISLKNDDCGPASLATAMKSLGKLPERGAYEAQINSMREQMTGTDDHMKGTTIGQMESAARMNGLKATTISGLKAVQVALEHHAVVVLGGQPTHMLNGVNYEGTTKNKVDSIGHFVTVLGYDRVTKTYTVDDSEKRGPTEVSRAQMRAFVTKPSGGLFSGVALSRDASHFAPRAVVPTSLNEAALSAPSPNGLTAKSHGSRYYLQ